MSNACPEISRRHLLASTISILAASAFTAACGNQSDIRTRQALAPDVSNGPDPILELLKESSKQPLVFPDYAHVSSSSPNFDGSLSPIDLQSDGVPALAYIATQGLHFIDPDLIKNRRATAEAQSLSIAYCYLETGVSPEKQADHFVQALVDSDPAKPGKIAPADIKSLLVADVEFQDPKDETYGVTIDEVQRFTDRVKQLTQRRVGIYTMARYWGSKGRHGILGNPDAPDGTYLWLANYVVDDKLEPISGQAGEILQQVSPPTALDDPWKKHPVGNWPYYTIRQYTDRALYRQYQQRVIDFNVSWLTLNQLGVYGKYRAGELQKSGPLALPGYKT